MDVPVRCRAGAAAGTDSGKTYSMEIYIDESVMEVYVGGTTALSVRAYDLHDRKFGLAVSDGKVRFENIQLTTMGG